MMRQVSFEAASENRHFAIVSDSRPKEFSPLKRKSASTSYRSELFIYDSSGGNHHRLTTILDALPKRAEAGPAVARSVRPAEVVSRPPSIEQHLSDKLMTSAGSPIFIRPRLKKVVIGEEEELYTNQDSALPFEAVLSDNCTTVIMAPHEYGLSTLGDVLEYSLQDPCRRAVVRSAEALANYAAKLKGDLRLKGEKYHTLILDDVRPSHQKLLNALQQIDEFERIIILTHDTDTGNAFDLSKFGKVQYFRLLPLSREGVRIVAEKVAPLSATSQVPAATTKAYRDLLDLAIPLTPANVVMYLSVVFRDHAFSPLSRLDIIERYLESRLSRASDAYRESFSSTNKIDLISGFVFNIRNEGKVDFSDADWLALCRTYKSERLVHFDHNELLRDLEDSRIVIRSYDGKKLYFCYRIFYVYFLGKHIADRPSIFLSQLSSGEYLSVTGLVEILSGLSKDNMALLTDLTERMERAVEDFYSRHAIRAFDLHKHLKWERSKEEEKRDWELVEASLQDGPLDEQYKDQSERSFIEELRSERQGVTINSDIISANGSIAELMTPLSIAIGNSVDVPGDLKKRAAKAILSAHKISFQLACLWAGEIASNRVTVVEGIGFINLLRHEDGESEDHRTSRILSMTPSVISSYAEKELGSRKLGEIYKALSRDKELSGFSRLLNLWLLIVVKPQDWEAAAANVIESMESKELYLRYARSAIMRNYREGINTGQDLEGLKRLVARIHTRRDIGKDHAGKRDIQKILNSLEKQGAFAAPKEVREGD